MVRVVPVVEHEIRKDQTMDSCIQKLLYEYQLLFSEPIGLPSSRGSFDHRIPLAIVSNPVNTRPYIYSYAHKDIIERLIQKMLG